MDSMSRIKDQAPARYAALADTPRVMGEARDALADLHSAAMELGRALVDAGLPKPVWRSEQATLRLLSTTLPAITVDAYLTRLETFATRDGPAWLHGAHDDLEAFHKEVVGLIQVTRPLREIVHRLQHLPVDMPAGGPRSDHPLQRVVRSPRLQPPLDAIAEILSGLEALAPFMRPLTSAQWRALRRPSGLSPARAWNAVAVWASGLRKRAGSASPAPATTGAAAKANTILQACRAWILQRLAWLRRRTRAQRLLLASGLLVAAVAALGALALSRQPNLTGQATTIPSSAARTVLAETGTATALATQSLVSSPTPGATAGVAPKLTLTCVVHGATATLTIKNAGASALTWQAQPPPTLTLTPTQGALQAGQSATAQASAVNKKSASGTITVIASHDTVATENKVACR